MTDLPDVLPGHWANIEGAAMARQYADMPREHLAGGPMFTDMAMANEVYLRPNIMNLTAAKDRIRWLSVQLAIANSDKAELLKALESAAHSFDRAYQQHPDNGEAEMIDQAAKDARAAFVKVSGK